MGSAAEESLVVLCQASMRYAARDGALLGPIVDVAVHDARRSSLPEWDVCGFQLVSHPSDVSSWMDDDEIAQVHYAEIEEVARQLTGCDAALVSDHVRRTARDRRGPKEQTPVHLVHSDFAADYADVIRHNYDEVHGRGERTLARTGVRARDIHRARRVMMMQFWRNTGPTDMDQPLAFCDARTVTPDDTRPFLYTGYVAGGRSFNALAVVAPERPSQHRWFSFPRLSAHEVVAFRTFDSDLVDRGATWFTPHTSFRNSRAPHDLPPRESVELRVLCLWK
ncbi:MAG TPA: CmcJ/NvfI family oxidoreductase [Acidimicrobiales bacterium]|jgi:hypothetical protein|nr:CmcJ/NvfI family oxidoreductase [Acidimicrobiales bacterium]